MFRQVCDIRSRNCRVRQGLEQLEQRQMLSGTPQLLADINTTAANASSYPGGFVAVGDSVLFSANDGVHGSELWRTDGTTQGTELIYDLRPGSSGGGMGPRIMFEGNLLFHATVGTGDYELWTTDGTLPGTTHLSNVSFSTGLEYNGMVLFNGEGDLYATDGTSAGTHRVAGFGPAASPLAPSDLVELNGLVYFRGRINTTTDFGLWRTDGTSEGTVLVNGDIDPVTIVKANGRLVILSSSSHYYSSDGTKSGTQKILDKSPWGRAAASFVVRDEVAYFSYYRPDNTKLEDLWRTDGTVAGTFPIKQVMAKRSTVIRETIYFLGTTSGADWELWKSDGTTEGTRRIKDIRPGEQGAFRTDQSHHLSEVNGVLYFRADDGSGSRLWRSDGTEEGTWVVPGSPVDPQAMTNINGTLYFSARDDDHGQELWVLRPESQVVGRQIFYNNSKFDGGSAAANAADDNAIAQDKVAYLTGSGLATTASVSSYSRGINGVMIDLVNPEDALITVDDFIFHIGTSDSPGTWAPAPAPLEVVVRAEAGVGGSDRVTITWADGAIKNTWLQVIAEGNDAAGGFNTNTGLAESDVFYFGNRVGDTFVGALAASTVTSAADELGARFNPGINQPVTNLYDFNRDGIVSAADQLIARSNGGLLMMLALTESLAEATALPTPAIDEISTGAPTADDAHWWLAFALAASELEEELSAGNLR